MIETERLLLRRIEATDIDELIAIHAQPAVMHFMGSFDRSEALRWMERNRSEWDKFGYGRLAIVENSTGRFLGRSGLKYWPQFGETEVGWLLRPDAWGRGYATEAGRACVEWGFRQLDLPRITAMIRPDNHRSIKVAERIAMEPLRGDVLLGEPVIVYATQGTDLRPATTGGP